MGQGQFETIQTWGQTSGNIDIMAIKEHQTFVALSDSFFLKQANFKVFDSAFIERAIPSPSDGSI